MYRCKIGKGISKGFQGLKIVICVVLLFYLLSYSSFVHDTYSNVTYDSAKHKQSFNKSTTIETTTHADGTTTSKVGNEFANSDKNEDDQTVNENKYLANKDDLITDDDLVINDSNDKTKENQDAINRDDRENENNVILNKENRITREDEHIFTDNDQKLDEENLTINDDLQIAEDSQISSHADDFKNREEGINNDKDQIFDNIESEVNGYDRNLNEGNRNENDDDHNLNEDDRYIYEENRNLNKDNHNVNNENRNIINDGLNINVGGRKRKRKDNGIINDVNNEPSEEKSVINEKFFGGNRKVIGCQELFKKDISGAHRARKIINEELPTWNCRKYKEKTANCSSFIEERGYITHHLTTEEQQFPIAYSILMYKNVEQVERLLRAIYRPQNIYCIHVDSKTNNDIYKALSSIGQCFENVFVLRKRINVIWGKMSVLTPELLCMKELLYRHKTWKYFINLTGQEFPLKTNYELVKILQAYNGANDVEATVKQFRERCRRKSRVRPPHGIRVTNGAVHVAVTRGYVDYILHNHKARAILKWMSYACDIPDEAFFTTLNHNPHLHVPGSYKGFPETTAIANNKKPFLARYKNRLNSQLHRWPCHGKWVRGMCIFNYRDLHQLSTRKELFANKFHLYDNPLPYACMEELIFNRTRDEFQGKVRFDASWYSTLGFVKNHF